MECPSGQEEEHVAIGEEADVGSVLYERVRSSLLGMAVMLSMIRCQLEIRLKLGMLANSPECLSASAFHVRVAYSESADLEWREDPGSNASSVAILCEPS